MQYLRPPPIMLQEMKVNLMGCEESFTINRRHPLR